MAPPRRNWRLRNSTNLNGRPNAVCRIADLEINRIYQITFSHLILGQKSNFGGENGGQNGRKKTAKSVVQQQFLDFRHFGGHRNGLWNRLLCGQQFISNNGEGEWPRTEASRSSGTPGQN
jgi:hypothetical protein